MWAKEFNQYQERSDEILPLRTASLRCPQRGVLNDGRHLQARFCKSTNPGMSLVTMRP